MWIFFVRRRELEGFSQRRAKGEKRDTRRVLRKKGWCEEKEEETLGEG